MKSMFKFGAPLDEDMDRQWEYAHAWALEETRGGGTRLIVAPARDQVKTLMDLLQPMSGSFWLLYVLVVPRGDGEWGRYQSPEPKTNDEVRTFLTEFRDFLETDARHNLWIGSTTSSELLVYDCHNVIYAYGPPDAFQPVLAANGLFEVDEIRFPSPHSHHYHQTMDAEEKRLLSHWDWILSPLRDGDDE